MFGGGLPWPWPEGPLDAVSLSSLVSWEAYILVIGRLLGAPPRTGT